MIRSLIRPLIRCAVCALLVTPIVACGGSAPVADAPVATTPATSTAPAPGPTQQVDQRVWYVYWDEIHSLTVYPQSGPIRSEEPGNSVPPFGESRTGWSVISTYWEKERMFAPQIAAATDLDDLIARFTAMADQLVRVEEAVNPIYLQ